MVVVIYASGTLVVFTQCVVDLCCTDLNRWKLTEQVLKHRLKESEILRELLDFTFGCLASHAIPACIFAYEILTSKGLISTSFLKNPFARQLICTITETSNVSISSMRADIYFEVHSHFLPPNFLSFSVFLIQCT